MTSERYNARESEPRWQRQWDKKAIFASRNDDPRPKYYVLEMFPYPSGRIHIGHVRNYTLGDVLARFMRAKGFNVLHPMGWDAFGLPAENAAIERKVAPKAWTYDNIAAMKKHSARSGCRSTGPENSRPAIPPTTSTSRRCSWTFCARAGRTREAQDQLGSGRHDRARQRAGDRRRGWRSGAIVELREMNQWVFKITKYAQELLDRARHAGSLARQGAADAAQLDRPQRRHADPLRTRPGTAPNGERELKIFTTRHDTLFGAKFMAIAPDHPLAMAAALRNPKLAAFIAEAKRHGTAQEIIDTQEKLGFDTGIRANPPVRCRVEIAGLCRQFRADGIRHWRDLRLPRARPARPRFCHKYGLGNTPVVCPPMSTQNFRHYRYCL